MEDLDCRAGEPDIDLSAGRRVGNAVEAAVGLDVVVDADPGPSPLAELLTPGRERVERGAIQILGEAAAATFGLLERPLVERRQKGQDRAAGLGEREEAAVADSDGVNAPSRRHRNVPR